MPEGVTNSVCMPLSIHEQFLHTLEQAKRPLIVLSEEPNADDFAAAFSCAALLSKMQKPVEIVTSGGVTPKSLQFLGTPAPVRGDLPNIRKLTIHVKATETKVDELSYDISGEEVQIHLIPKTGTWNEQDVRITTDSYKFDLIISFGAQGFENFGKLSKQYADFFFQIPIINIDHSSANEHFGQINIVDINAVSSTEVLFDILEHIDKGLIDEEMATFLLTGMIFKTHSFRSTNVSPKTLKVAGKLISAGARRDEIVEKLYKTRTVETLRLWGRALARLKSDEKHGIVWTLLTQQDFANAGAGFEALENIMEELMMSSPHARIAAVFYEHPKKHIEVLLRATRPHDALQLGAPFRAAGTREEARLRLADEDIVLAEKHVITHIKEQVNKSR